MKGHSADAPGFASTSCRQVFRMEWNSQTHEDRLASDIREPLYTFRCPKLGYDIVMIPHSEQDRVRLKREAKRKGMSLVEFARDELLDVLVSCGQIE